MNLNDKHTVGIYTLGCKVNQYESEAIAEELTRRGFCVVSPNTVCDAYIINTCTVTAESDRKARQFIRRAISKNAAAYIVVSGCLAQTAPEKIAEIEGVDAIVGNSQKMLCADCLSALFEKGKKNERAEITVTPIDTAPFEPMQIERFDRTRAYIKIEDGCENRCTYCIIPSARGKVRSKSPADVLDEVRRLTESGCPEVVLTGIETASYGKDLGGIDLGDLLCKVDNINGIGRVRLGSLDPSLIKPAFADKLAALSSIAPHFHLSLQSGSDRILALMKRKYNSDMAMRAIKLLRERLDGVMFTTDIIVGFPDESEEDFLATARFVQEAEFLTVHIFPYSKREGTPAAKMQNQVPENVKSERLHRLEQIAADARIRVLARELERCDTHKVLFETYDGEYAHGHTPSFIEVAVKSDRPLRSESYNVKLTRIENGCCLGEIIG